MSPFDSVDRHRASSPAEKNEPFRWPTYSFSAEPEREAKRERDDDAGGGGAGPEGKKSRTE